MTVYVILIQRPIDSEPWATVYTSLGLATNAYGRVSPVVPVEIEPEQLPTSEKP